MSEFSPASLARSKVSCGIATTAKTSFLDRATSTTNVKVPVTGVLHKNCDFRSLDIPVRVLANECQGACHRRTLTKGEKHNTAQHHFFIRLR